MTEARTTYTSDMFDLKGIGTVPTTYLAFLRFSLFCVAGRNGVVFG